MVEIKPILNMRKRIFSYLIPLLSLAAGAAYAQQPVVRIASLAANAEYIDLLEQAKAGAADSLAEAALHQRIDAIEQQWLADNLHTTGPVADSLRQPRPLYNAYIKANLPAGDFEALNRARAAETQLQADIDRYTANHRRLEALRKAYEQTDNEAKGLEIQEQFEQLTDENDRLDEAIGTAWNTIFDDQNYAYTYLFDKADRTAQLDRQEQLMNEADQQLADVRGQYVSDALAACTVQKRVLLALESELAAMLQLPSVAEEFDHLRRTLDDKVWQLAPIALKERTFIEYEAVKFPVPYIYDARRPIPEGRVYPRGTIYRILLGTFNTKQSVSIFRGTAPLCYIRDEQGRWSYYAGGYESREEALDAQAILLKRGFRRPEVVRWTDGTAVNLDREPAPDTAAAAACRIEIRGVATLTERMRTTVKEAAPEAEFSKVGQMFVASPVNRAATAEKIAAALRQANPELTVTVVEIAHE